MEAEDYRELVGDYCELDEQIKELSKQKDKLKDMICVHMDIDGIDKISTPQFTLSRSVSHRTKVDEDKMVDIVKGWYINEPCLIKTKEYVDTDVLEDLAYNGVITPNQLKELDKCRKVTEFVTLRPTKRKGG